MLRRLYDESGGGRDDSAQTRQPFDFDEAPGGGLVGGEFSPASVGSLVFTRGDEERCYAVTVKDDGVYLSSGLTLIVH